MNAHRKKSRLDWSRHLHRSDLHGAVRLGVSATGAAADVVQEWHLRLLGGRLAGGIAGRVSTAAYDTVRSSANRVGSWADRLLGGADPGEEEHESSSEREAVLAVLNGFFGDRLAAAANPLAIPMRLRHGGRALELDKQALAHSLPHATGKILVLVHGLCRTDLQWRRDEHDHGHALGERHGYTPLYLHYNSGRHLSENGREFAQLMEALVAAWPVKVEQVAIIGHSMGGLVARSACHYAAQARHRWIRRLRHLVFLGTPHHGAPLERKGNWLAELLGNVVLVAPFGRLARLRSAGITDLRYGSLVDEDWQGRDRFAPGDERAQVPLPAGVHCYAVAGTTGRRRGDFRDLLLGDGLVPLDTALGRHADAARTLSFPEAHQWVGFGVHHMDLLSRREVYEQLEAWLGPAAARKPFRRPRRTLHDTFGHRHDGAATKAPRPRRAKS